MQAHFYSALRSQAHNIIDEPCLEDPMHSAVLVYFPFVFPNTATPVPLSP